MRGRPIGVTFSPEPNPQPPSFDRTRRSSARNPTLNTDFIPSADIASEPTYAPAHRVIQYAGRAWRRPREWKVNHEGATRSGRDRHPRGTGLWESHRKAPGRGRSCRRAHITHETP